MKDYESAITCYDDALKLDPNDLPVLINKISALRKKGNLDEALSNCNKILESNPNYNIVLYHKERILLSKKQFDQSITCCNKILLDYPDNGDVLFDKACSLLMISKIDEALDNLEKSINQGVQYKVKAKTSKFFEDIRENERFKNLIS